MKIKSGLISHEISGEYVIVASGEAADVFNGMIRSNRIVIDILKLLEQQTSEEEIIENLYQKYDAPKEVITTDVNRIILKLKEIGLLDE